MSNVTVVESKPKPPMVVLSDFLNARINSLKTALPPHISADRFIRVVLTAVQYNQDLLACDRQTLWNSCLRCASDGLLPDGREAALVPFKSKVTYIPMYGGLLKKFRNSGQFKWITAGIVYEGEEYEHHIDETGEHFRHVPGDNNEGKKIRRIYALATTRDGGSFIADLPLSDINKRRNMSRATREDAPWKVWPDEMMKKTAIRVLSKLLPMSSDIDALIQRDEEALLGVESVEDARIALSERPSTQQALDHFGGDTTNEPLPTADDVRGILRDDDSEPGTNQEHDQSEGTPSAADQGPAEAATAQPAGSFIDPIRAALERGRADHAKGMQRKAVPVEWREKEHTALASAWLRGWDAGDAAKTGRPA